jgi:hypothetical protein
MALLCRVAINPDRIEINISRRHLAEFLAGQPIDQTRQDQTLDRDSDDVVTLTSPARLKRVGREMRMLVEKLRSPDGSRSEFVEDYRTRSRYPDTP